MTVTTGGGAADVPVSYLATWLRTTRPSDRAVHRVHRSVSRTVVGSQSEPLVDDLDLVDSTEIEQLPTEATRRARASHLIRTKQLPAVRAAPVAVRLDYALVPAVLEYEKPTGVDGFTNDAAHRNLADPAERAASESGRDARRRVPWRRIPTALQAGRRGSSQGRSRGAPWPSGSPS